MHDKSTSNYLIASPDPALLSVLEPVLATHGAHLDIALSAESAAAMLARSARYNLVLLDADLPGMDFGQLLAAASERAAAAHFPILVAAGSVTPELLDRLAEGVVDHLVPRSMEPLFWQAQIGIALRAHRATLDLERLRDTSALSALYDRLTGVYNRSSMLSLLFRETDRIQRMKGSLCLVLFDIDDFGHWNSRLGSEACDDLLCQVSGRVTRLLRSYDLLGRVGKDEFLIAMPGCSTVNALMLAERLRADVFGTPYLVDDQPVRLSACFGIAASNGRSPLVVLREAEQALATARGQGIESIQCFGERKSGPGGVFADCDAPLARMAS